MSTKEDATLVPSTHNVSFINSTLEIIYNFILNTWELLKSIIQIIGVDPSEVKLIEYIETRNPALLIEKEQDDGSSLSRLINYFHLDLLQLDKTSSKTAMIAMEQYDQADFLKLIVFGIGLSVAGVVAWLLFNFNTPPKEEHVPEDWAFWIQEWANESDRISEFYRNSEEELSTGSENSSLESKRYVPLTSSETSFTSISNTKELYEMFKSIEK